MTTRILATASYLPPRIVRNEDLSQFSPEAIGMIEAKTGIQSRRHADDSQCTSDLAIACGKRCLDQIGFKAKDLGALIIATSSPDRIQPATATRVQHALAAHQAYAFDLNSVCSGAVFALHVADCLIKADGRPVLLIASEVYSRFLNPRDFSTYPFFGDGAGAALLDKGPVGILGSVLHTDGAGADVIQVPAGGTMLPFARCGDMAAGYFRMQGREVYKFATVAGATVITEITARFGVRVNDIRCFVCHQANLHILKDIARQIDVDFARFHICLHKYGNTAAASVLIALDEVLSEGIAGPGDLIVLVAFGGGLSWGANLIRL